MRMLRIVTLLQICLMIVAFCPFKSTQAVEVDESLAVIVPGSGTYSRPISTDSEMTQTFFDQGLRLAWGFYFPESIASYQQASAYDPDHPMPYWGMAHAMGPNPNSRYIQMPDDPLGEGLKAIKNAMDRIDNASSIEAELIQAMWIAYDKQSIPDQLTRDRAYLAEMRKLNQKYPNDSDIAALYAASYMNIGRWDYWDSEGNPKDETAAVADALDHIIASDLTNPGVLHLHIHLLEASMEPERALISADNLERSLPIGGHVVHMPAHIYVRIGQFQRAIDQNVRSKAVDKQFAKIWGDTQMPNIGTYPLSHKLHAGHSTDFIRYAAAVQGNYEIAISAAEEAKAIALTHGHVHRAQKPIAAPWLILKIFGKWDKIIGQQPSHSGMPYLDAMWAYVMGSALLNSGDMSGAETQLETLRQIAESPGADQYRAGPTPVSSIVKLTYLGLSGEIHAANGEYEHAIAAFREGVALEDQNNYTEPPDWAQPMRHYLGAVLLKAERFDEAEAVYRRDLKWNHNNGWALFGLEQALSAQGKDAEAQQVKNEFMKAWGYSDVELTSSHF